MGAVADFVGDVVGGVVDAVGDVVETVGDVVSDAVEFVGDTVQAVVNDPLPTLLAIAGQAVGIPAPITMAAVTASRGGDLTDIVLSAGTAYFAPELTSSLHTVIAPTIADVIVNEAVSDVVSNGISRGLVNGTIAEIRGGDFDDGFAGAFTGTVVGAGMGEVTNFVRPDIVESLGDLGVAQDTANSIINAGRNALTAGVTAEITGRSDFDTAFTNSLINSTSTGITNFATTTISNQFDSIASTNNEIVGAEAGNERDEAEVSAALVDAWANRDITAINSIVESNELTADDLKSMFDLTDEDVNTLSNNGIDFYSNDKDTSATSVLKNNDTGEIIGTGAGINSTLVDEIDTGLEGINTGDASDVISEDSTTFTSNDLGGDASVSTISGSDSSGLFDYSPDRAQHIDLSWLDTKPTGTPDEVADIYGPFPEEAGIYAPTDEVGEPVGGLTSVIPSVEEETTTGGLSAVTPLPESISTAPISTPEVTTGEPTNKNFVARDLLSEVTPDVSAYTETGERVADVGGLNNLVDQGARGVFGVSVPGMGTPEAAVTGALSSALKQGITKSLQGRITKPTTKTVTRRVPVKTIKTTAPQSGLKTAVPLKADMKTLRPTTTTKVAPKKVDVRTLSPVKNIAGLTSLLGGKG